MKKTLLAAALSGAFATMAHAQSSVTLYGLIDAGITYTNTMVEFKGKGGKVRGRNDAWGVSSSSLSASRWGLRGSEDLGGGLKGVFTLESRFDVNGGLFEQNELFGSRAFVGLAGNEWGSVTLGRQSDFITDYLAPISMVGADGGTLFSHPLYNDNLTGALRMNNSVKFSSANYNGLSLGAMYGFSNVHQFTNNRGYSFGAGYNYGPFNLSAAYLRINNPHAFDKNNNPNGAFGETLVRRHHIWGAGTSYSFGPAKVGFVWTQSRSDRKEKEEAVPFILRVNNYEVNARYALTPALGVTGAYTYTDGRLRVENLGKDDLQFKSRWHQGSLLFDYALSKRTDVYLAGVYRQPRTTGKVSSHDVSGRLTAKSFAVSTGIRHSF